MKFWNVKNLNNNTDSGAGAPAVEAEPLAKFADFSVDGNTGDSKYEEKMEPVKEEKVATPAANTPSPVADETEIKKTDESATSLKTFDIPEEKEETAAVVPSNSPQQWVDLAKNIGLEIPDGTEVKSADDFKILHNKKIEALSAQAEANKRLVNKDELLKQFNPETRQIVEFIDNGGDLQDFLEPGKVAEQYLTMSSEDLMKEELRALGVPEANIDARVTQLVENGMLEFETDKLRAQIKNAAEDQKRDILSSVSAVKQKRIAEEQASDSNKTNAIIESLNKTTEFLGGAITQKERDYIIKEYTSGRTKQILNDPNVIAEVLLFKAFGKQALGETRKLEYAKGRESIQDNLFNIPPKLASGAADRKTHTPPAKEGDFSSWGKVRDQIGG